MPLTAPDSVRAAEATEVYDWRVEKFEEMRDARGDRFTARQVRELAKGTSDLHRARQMLVDGCAIFTAFDILS